MLSKLPAESQPAGTGWISRWNADSAALCRRSDAGRPVDRERDAVQVANPQKLIWTRLTPGILAPRALRGGRLDARIRHRNYERQHLVVVGLALSDVEGQQRFGCRFR